MKRTAFVFCIIYILINNLYSSYITVCPSGCTYTSMAMGMGNAIDGDTVVLMADIEESASLPDKKIIITSDTGARVWDCYDDGLTTRNTLTLNGATSYTGVTITGLILDNSSSTGGRTVAIPSVSNCNVTFDNCIFRRTSGSSTNAGVFYITGGSTNCPVIKNSIIQGSSTADGIITASTSADYTIFVYNSVIERARIGIRSDNSTSYIGVKIYNTTFSCNINGAFRKTNTSLDIGGEIKNCLFVNNGADITVVQNIHKKYISYCAFSKEPYDAAFGPGCHFGITPSAEVIDPACGSTDLRMNSNILNKSIDNGISIPGINSDIIGVSRDEGGSSDIGAYEYDYPDTPTLTNTLTPVPEIPTVTQSITQTTTKTITGTITLTNTITATESITSTATKTITGTVTPTNSMTATESITATATFVEVETGTITKTITPSLTITVTNTVTNTATSFYIETPTPTIAPDSFTDMPDEDDSLACPNLIKSGSKIKIVFNLNKKMDVVLYIYKSNGNFVEMKEYPIGYSPNEKLYMILLDTDGYSPGIYYYIIKGIAQDGENKIFRTRKFIVRQ